MRLETTRVLPPRAAPATPEKRALQFGAKPTNGWAKRAPRSNGVRRPWPLTGNAPNGAQAFIGADAGTSSVAERYPDSNGAYRHDPEMRARFRRPEICSALAAGRALGGELIGIARCSDFVSSAMGEWRTPCSSLRPPHSERQRPTALTLFGGPSEVNASVKAYLRSAGRIRRSASGRRRARNPSWVASQMTPSQAVPRAPRPIPLAITPRPVDDLLPKWPSLKIQDSLEPGDAGALAIIKHSSDAELTGMKHPELSARHDIRLPCRAIALFRPGAFLTARRHACVIPNGGGRSSSRVEERNAGWWNESARGRWLPRLPP